VREALIALEVEGLGRGSHRLRIYVQPGNEDAVARQARTKAEAGRSSSCARVTSSKRKCAALAAKSAKKAQLVAISEALARCSAKWRLASTILSTATGSSTCASPKRPGTERWWRSSRCCGWSGPARCISKLEHHYDSPALWEAAMTEHRAVLKAIASRDAQAARAAMQRHLNQAYKRFSIGWDNLQ
jgi:DNA-binding FadR family transcriptional regulator